jgi:hypothetical protein
MTLDEMTLLPEQFPSLRQTGFFVGGYDWASNTIAIPLIMAGLKLFPGVKPLTWGKLLCWSHRTFNRPPYGTCLVLVAEGLKDGERVSYTLSLLKDDEYELTAIPMVATIEQMFDGTAHKPGLHRMALLCEPERLIQDMKSMGVKFEEKERRHETTQ